MAELPYSEAVAGTKPVGLGGAGRAGPVENEAVLRMANYQALVARATDVFGDAVKASRWLSLPNADLGGKVPLRVAQENGYDLAPFESIFARIEHGIDY
jgi:uncharacterized protein (DUF2384 family)